MSCLCFGWQAGQRLFTHGGNGVRNEKRVGDRCEKLDLFFFLLKVLLFLAFGDSVYWF